MEKKKINFKQIEVPTNYDGNETVVADASKDIAAVIYNKSTNYDDFELGREIHTKGEVEIDEQQAGRIKQYVSMGALTYFAQEAICKALDSLFNNNQN